jgi:hypothetical protein
MAMTLSWRDCRQGISGLNLSTRRQLDDLTFILVVFRTAFGQWKTMETGILFPADGCKQGERI